MMAWLKTWRTSAITAKTRGNFLACNKTRPTTKSMWPNNNYNALTFGCKSRIKISLKMQSNRHNFRWLLNTEISLAPNCFIKQKKTGKQQKELHNFGCQFRRNCIGGIKSAFRQIVQFKRSVARKLCWLYS